MLKSTPFNSFMFSNEVIHLSSCLHTPQRNGIIESKLLYYGNCVYFFVSNNYPLKILVIFIYYFSNICKEYLPLFMTRYHILYCFLTNPCYITPWVFVTCFAYDLTLGFFVS